MELTVRLKATKTDGGEAASSFVPPMFRFEEIIAMPRACQLPAEDVRDLESASGCSSIDSLIHNTLLWSEPILVSLCVR
jgi:hypothetical protein